MDDCTYKSHSDEEYEKLSNNINSKPIATIKQEPEDVNLDTEESSFMWTESAENDDKVVFKAGDVSRYNEQVSITLENFKAGVAYGGFHGETSRSELSSEETSTEYKYSVGDNIKVHKMNMKEGYQSRIAEVKLELDNLKDTGKVQHDFIIKAKTELQDVGRVKIENGILDRVGSDDEHAQGNMSEMKLYEKELKKVVDDCDNLRDKSVDYNHNAFINYKVSKSIRSDSKVASRVFQCKFCQFETKYKCTLVHHFTLKHDETAEWLHCEFCEYKAKGKCLLKRHVDSKHNDSWVQCSFCEYRSKSKPSLTQHLRLKHNSSLELLKCSFCEYTTKNKWELKKHVNCKHLKDQHNWKQCQFCEYKARDKYNLRKHIEHKHHGLFHCPSCPHGAKSISLLENHIKNVHGTVLDLSTVKLVNIEQSSVDSVTKETDGMKNRFVEMRPKVTPI